MEDEELKEKIQKVNDSLKDFPKDNKSISKKEKRDLGILISQQQALERIKVAKEKIINPTKPALIQRLYSKEKLVIFEAKM